VTGRDRWLALWASFPVLRYAEIEPAATREALDALDAWAVRQATEGSGAGTQAALFVLDCWDSRAKWKAGHFDLFAAFNTWDDRQVAAFQSWAASPFRP